MWRRNGAAALVFAVAGIGCCSSLVLAHGGGGMRDVEGDAPEALQDVRLVRFGHVEHMVFNLHFVVPEGEDKGRVRTAEEEVHAELFLDMGSRRAGAEYVAV